MDKQTTAEQRLIVGLRSWYDEIQNALLRAIGGVTEKRYVGRRETKPEESTDYTAALSFFNEDKWRDRLNEILTPIESEIITGVMKKAAFDVAMNWDDIESTKTDKILKAAINATSEKISTVSGNLKTDLQRVLEGMNGKSVDEVTKAIEERFSDIYKKSGAKRIAQTTATFSTNNGAKATFNEFGYDTLWLHTGAAAAPRQSHIEANGRRQNEQGLFEVGGELVQHPGDGSAANAINCHCALRPRPRKG